MTAKKSPSTTASKSTELTDATKSEVSTSNPQIIMQPDNSTNSIISTSTVNSDNAVNSITPANADNLFDNEQTVTEPPKQQRIGKQQRKSDFAVKAGEASSGQHRGQRMGEVGTYRPYPRRPRHHCRQLHQRYPCRASNNVC